MKDLVGKIKGPIYPICTPFNEDESLDIDGIKNYVDFLMDGGAKVIYVTAHTSRFPLLSFDEMKQVNEAVIKQVKKNDSEAVAIAADPWMCSTKVSAEFAKHAQECGADAISLIYGERVYNENNVYEHFKSVADQVNIGILIHEQPLFTIFGSKMMAYPLDLLDRIADIENVIAIKEDAKEDDYTEQAVNLLKDRLAIIVSGGSKEQFMKFYKMGCQAYLVGVASFDPAIGMKFYNHLEAGEENEAQEIIQDFERPFFEISKAFGWHIGLKSALWHLGLMNSIERSPLKELNKEGHQKIKEVLIKCGWIK